MQKKNTSFGLVASARRQRLISALGRYSMAKSSAIRCSTVRFLEPLTGTSTKHISGVQKLSSSECTRTKSPASEMRRTGSAVCRTSTAAIVGGRVTLNRSRLAPLGLMIEIGSASILTEEAGLLTLSFIGNFLLA
jgi:hypothetical protein